MQPKKNVLLAINDAMIALDVEDLLQSHFDLTVSTCNIQEAEQKLEIITPDLVIIDCDINYPNVCTFLARIEHGDIDKICFCTSEKQLDALKDEKTEVLLKPFDSDELEKLVSHILQV